MSQIVSSTAFKAAKRIFAVSSSVPNVVPLIKYVVGKVSNYDEEVVCNDLMMGACVCVCGEDSSRKSTAKRARFCR